MKLIYLTAKKYPSTKVSPGFVRSMAESFYEILGDNFLFFVRGEIPDDLQYMNIKSAPAPSCNLTLSLN